MNEILLMIQQRIAQVEGLRYVGENWGQLNLLHPPVNFPCALIELAEVKYSNAGRNSQNAEAVIQVTIADIRYDGAASFAPDRINEQAYHIFILMDQVNGMLHGYGSKLHSKLVRLRTDSSPREDTVREFVISYRCTFMDETTLREYNPAQAEPNIEITN